MKLLLSLLLAGGIYAQVPLPTFSGSGGGGGSGGTGCIPVGIATQILVSDGAGGCNQATPTISGSTITASLTGHASLDAPIASPTFTGTVTIPNGGVFGTPTSMTATNVTGLPLTTGVTGTLPNSNTTAASANTASAIVARDASGNFTAGTITAALTGNASTASAVAVGGITGLGTGVGTWLATPSGANLSSALTTPLTTTGGGLGAALNAAAAHSTVISNGATPAVYSAKVIPDCTDAGGNHLNFTQSTDAWSCGNTSGGGSTLTNSFILPGGNSFENSDAMKGTSGMLFCADFPLPAAVQVSQIWTYISTADSGKVWGAALYDSAGSLLTASTSTGSSAGMGGQIDSVFGGGAVTLSPGTAGRATICTTSNSASTFALIAEIGGVVTFQDPAHPIRYTAANAASESGGTITWPATLGAKTAMGGGQRFGWVAIVP